MAPSLGIYLSIPFCRAKCTFCNFSSGVFGADALAGYVDRLCAEIADARAHAGRMGLPEPGTVDSIYFGGGTPSLLEPAMVRQIFAALGRELEIEPGAEVTMECAPGQLAADSLHCWLAEGLTRVSLGVQSFTDAESAAVGRLHTADGCHAEIARLGTAGVGRVGVDLICGLPHQTMESWEWSVREALASGVEHVSVYMLEVDEGSRLGREALAAGGRYGAADLPGEEEVADWYEAACGWLGAGGLPQYEISNFGQPSRHNVKYWRREPYLGFGLDAHSMLRCGAGGVRWGNTAKMGEYLAEQAGMLGARGWSRTEDRVDAAAGLEEALFLGLRMNCGVSRGELHGEFGEAAALVDFGDVAEAGLVEFAGDRVRLTAAGRVASNEVFGRLLG